MIPEPAHRKRVKHFNVLNTIHELTFSCYHRRPLLLEEPFRRFLGEAVSRAMIGHGFKLHAFVFMPEHVHLLVAPPPGTEYDISALLKAVKRTASFHVKQSMKATHDPRLAELTIRDRPGSTVFRFWQEGPGYDRNMTEYEAIESSINYIHHNPVKRGLCSTPEQWAWSSWRQWHDDQAPIPDHVPRIDKHMMR